MPKNKHFNVLRKIFKDECSTVVEIDHSEIDRIDRKKQGCTTCCSLAAGLRGNGEKMRKLRGNGERSRKWTENEEKEREK